VIEIDDDGNGNVEVWLGITGFWLLLASQPAVVEALIEAEKLLRDELTMVQAELHRARAQQVAR
jgi:hypothetical protein